MNLTLDAKKYRLKGKIDIEIYATSEEDVKEIVKAILRSLHYIRKIDEAEYIRILKNGRAKIVILDPEAEICGNCVRFHKEDCKFAIKPEGLKDHMAVKVDDPVCELFETERDILEEELNETAECEVSTLPVVRGLRAHGQLESGRELL